MNCEIYHEQGLLVTENNQRYSLYSSYYDEKSNQWLLKPAEYATDVKYIKVEPNAGLIILPTEIRDLSGNIITDQFGAPLEIARMQKNYLLVSASGTDQKIYRILLISGRNILLELTAYEVRYSNRYLAVRQADKWLVYDSYGTEITTETPIDANCSVSICADLLVCARAGNYALFLLKNGKLLISQQMLIVASTLKNFAICAAVTEGKVKTYFNGRWKNLEPVEGFEIASNKYMMFYVKRNNKYFLFDFKGTPVLLEEHPNGVDFVSVKEESGHLYVMDDGELYGYEYLSKF